MAKKNVSFISFVRNNGKLKLSPASKDGRKWTSMYIMDVEGNKIYVNPPQSTNDIVYDNVTGEVLVDFHESIDKVKASLEANKDKLVVLLGNKNWDSPEEEEIPVYTLQSKFADVEEVDVDI